MLALVGYAAKTQHPVKASTGCANADMTGCWTLCVRPPSLVLFQFSALELGTLNPGAQEFVPNLPQKAPGELEEKAGSSEPEEAPSEAVASGLIEFDWDSFVVVVGDEDVRAEVASGADGSAAAPSEAAGVADGAAAVVPQVGAAAAERQASVGRAAAESPANAISWLRGAGGKGGCGPPGLDLRGGARGRGPAGGSRGGAGPRDGRGGSALQ
ncbi:unnamed protein product, partial [Prorocentrum cordatum]